MITLFLMGLLGATVILGAVPFVLFALMLETCAERGKAHGASPAAARSTARRSEAPPSFRVVAAA